MADQWYCQLEGESVGPIDAAQLQALARRGRLTPESLIRTATSKGWVPAGKVGGLKFGESPPATGSATMRAPAALKKAKLLEPGISPGQIQRASDSHAMAAGIVPPPIPAQASAGFEPDPRYFAPPAPTGFDPTQIPTGIPVGVAVGAVPPPKGSVPQTPSSDSNVPWINDPSPPKPSSNSSRAAGDEKPGFDKKRAARRKLYLMIGGVAGICLALGVVGVIMAMRGGPATTENERQVAKKGIEQELAEAEAANKSSSTPAVADKSEDESDEPSSASGIASTDAKQASAPAATTEAATARSAGGKGAAPGDLATAIKSVSRWFDLASSSAVSSKSMKLQMTGAWLDDGAGASKPAEESEPVTKKSGTPRIYVELRIANTQADAPLNYTPWNGDGAGGGKTLALLATSDGQACTFVPVALTKEPARQKVPIRLKPGQAITELLVFEAPSAEYEELQLLLPTSAVGQAGRYLGLKLPRDLVAAQKPVELAQDEMPPRTVTANPRDASTAGSPPKVIANSESPAAAPQSRDETIDDLRKSIVDSVKDKQKERDDAVAKEREANKKKPD